ncbi:hypothetical protein OsI_19815 [Oryza sativa Indica Group]|jgi:hypothetical protein|uniref:Uncharacterized protein n=2 Tax=Oryza TaxID=4527 RepID=A0A0E0PLY5_ORYRU|nr:hypothetical protein OsI_19815 [Oryza sativa Indica Group]
MSRRLLGWLIPLSVGWYGGWKTARHLSEVEKLAEAAAPKPMARLLREYVFNGGAEARRAKQLDNDVREVSRLVAEVRELAVDIKRQRPPAAQPPPPPPPQGSPSRPSS